MMLFFFHSATCHACKVALPELNSLRARRFDFSVTFRSLDGAYNDAERDHVPVTDGSSWRPRTTPGYAVVHAGKLIDHREGAMKVAVLSKWLDECKQKVNESSPFYGTAKVLGKPAKPSKPTAPRGRR